MDKVRIGLMGYGKVANLHAEALKDVKNGELVAVAGTFAPKVRDAFAEKWHVKARESVADMVAHDHVDAVIIATPHPQHKDCALEAFKAGCHVLVEKPMAMTVAECDEMIAAGKKAGKILAIGTQRRYFPACKRIKDAIDDGTLGKPILCQATILGWRDQAYYKSDAWRGKWSTEGGGVLINQAPHQIDLMCWYMGPIEEVQGYWDNFNHPYIEVEDSAVAVVKFKSGGLASVLFSNSQNPGIYAKVHVHGDKGNSAGVQTDGGAMFIAGMSTITEPPLNDIWNVNKDTSMLDKYRAEDEAFFKGINATIYFFTREQEDFCASIITGKPPLAPGEQGRETVKFIESLYKAGNPKGKGINPRS
jgi:predicted dehydrogenase